MGQRRGELAAAQERGKRDVDWRHEENRGAEAGEALPATRHGWGVEGRGAGAPRLLASSLPADFDLRTRAASTRRAPP